MLFELRLRRSRQTRVRSFKSHDRQSNILRALLGTLLQDDREPYNDLCRIIRGRPQCTPIFKLTFLS